jgi:hypothetical protein
MNIASSRIRANAFTGLHQYITTLITSASTSASP